MKKHEKSRRRPAGRPSSPSSLHAARTRKEHALARIRELELARLEARSLDAVATAAEWRDILRRVRAGVLAVVSRVRSRLPHLSSSDATVIDEELRAALTTLAEDDA